jgi:quinohemoprotein ethanol dehydrogenase
MKGERSAIAALTGSNEEEQECTCSNDVHTTGIVAAPMTYMVDDVQYITIAVGWGGVYGMWNQNTKQINPGTVYTFGLGKKASKPTFPLKPEKSIVELPVTGSEKEIAHGGTLFDQYCSKCHTFDGGGTIPDLTFSTPETFNAFQDIVKGGKYFPKGMPKFDDRLSEQDVTDVKQYILSVATTKRTKAKVQ